MAGFNEILAGRFNRGLQKLFAMKGSPPVPSLASEIIPTHSLMNGVENLYLEGWGRFATNNAQGALAANNSAVRFRNPAGSNVIVVIEQLSAYESVADASGIFATLGPTGVDLGTPNPNPTSRLDPRGQPTPTLIASRANGAANIGQTIHTIPVLANTEVIFIVTDSHHITLLPGDAIQVSTSGLNAVLGVNILWRERFLEDSERT